MVYALNDNVLVVNNHANSTFGYLVDVFNPSANDLIRRKYAGYHAIAFYLKNAVITFFKPGDLVQFQGFQVLVCPMFIQVARLGFYINQRYKVALIGQAGILILSVNKPVAAYIKFLTYL